MTKAKRRVPRNSESSSRPYVFNPETRFPPVKPVDPNTLHFKNGMYYRKTHSGRVAIAPPQYNSLSREDAAEAMTDSHIEGRRKEVDKHRNKYAPTSADKKNKVVTDHNNDLFSLTNLRDTLKVRIHENSGGPALGEPFPVTQERNKIQRDRKKRLKETKKEIKELDSQEQKHLIPVDEHGRPLIPKDPNTQKRLKDYVDPNAKSRSKHGGASSSRYSGGSSSKHHGGSSK
jgi:hypothetical protein